MIGIVGAGAMGAAIAIVHARAGAAPVVLGTRFDERTLDACERGDPHPALGIALPSDVTFRRHADWTHIVGELERIVLVVSSDGLADTVTELALRAEPDAVWVIVTKGWDPSTLRTPSEVVGSPHTVVLAGPALAPEIAAGAPVALVAASADGVAAAAVASTLRDGGVAATTSDDVAGCEVSSAYKNVAAIAVGICEGLGDREAEKVVKHRYANARSALFAQGLTDMLALAAPRGGRPETVLGLAGAGDLYVTCLGGRNGTLGKLLGAGETAEQAQRTIGSTVEGVANTTAALALGERLGVDLPVARMVGSVLDGADPAAAVASALR